MGKKPSLKRKKRRRESTTRENKGRTRGQILLREARGKEVRLPEDVHRTLFEGKFLEEKASGGGECNPLEWEEWKEGRCFLHKKRGEHYLAYRRTFTGKSFGEARGWGILLILLREYFKFKLATFLGGGENTASMSRS